MTENTKVDSSDPNIKATSEKSDRLVYVLPEEFLHGQASDEINLGKLWGVIWDGKRLVAGIVALFAAASIAYALLATEWYRAEVLLAPAEELSTQGLAAQFGGLASLAGISVGGGGLAEPVAVLRSREFARDFIHELNLMPILFADEWDANTKQWISKKPEDQPDVRDAVRFFREDLLRVSPDGQTGLVNLELEWTNPEIAAEWASLLVRRLNNRMRQRALKEAEANVSYLQSELANVSVVPIQQSIGRLLETELQKLMLARGNQEFSFRVIDEAIPPKYRSHPKRALVILLGILVGGIVGIFVVLASHARQGRRA